MAAAPNRRPRPRAQPRPRPGPGPRPRADAAARDRDAGAIVIGIRRMVRALELYSHEVRRGFGLTAPQLWALKTLAEHGSLTTGELAERLFVHQSSTSLLILRLERRGLVRRSRQKNDRRFVRIELTDRGAAVAAAAPAPAQGRLVLGLRTMSARRVRQIRRAVDDLVGAMEAETVEPRFLFTEG